MNRMPGELSLEITQIDRENSSYPPALCCSGLSPPPAPIWAIGDHGILKRNLLGLFCSAKCPGEVILRTYDMARALREAGMPVIGGFHSPMEKECLDFLLRGTQPIVICPARAIQRMRIPAAWRGPIEAGRLLVVSPFEKKYRRATVKLSERRNRFVAALSTEAFIAHAGLGTKTEQLCQEMVDQGKPVRGVDVPDNVRLVATGLVRTSR